SRRSRAIPRARDETTDSQYVRLPGANKMGKAIGLNEAVESLSGLTVESLERRLESELGVSLRVAVSMEPARVEQLTSRERLHHDTLGNDRRLLSWLTGRAALKSLLGSLGDSDETMVIEFPHRRYSLTHSGNYAVAAGTASDELVGIGVDLEIH